MIQNVDQRPMTESEIQKEIMFELRLEGWYVLRLNSGRVHHNVRMCPPGTPDILAVSADGRLIWIEVKTPIGELSEIQIETHEDLEMRNQEVFVMTSAEDIQTIG